MPVLNSSLNCSPYRCTGLTMTGKAVALYFPQKLTVLEAICLFKISAHFMIIFLNMLMALLDIKIFQLLKIPVQCFKMPFR